MKDFTSTGYLFGLHGEDKHNVNLLFNKADEITLDHNYAENRKFVFIRKLHSYLEKDNINKEIDAQHFLFYINRNVTISDKLWGLKFENEEHELNYIKAFCELYYNKNIK